jgi:hypothetical protein
MDEPDSLKKASRAVVFTVLGDGTDSQVITPDQLPRLQAQVRRSVETAFANAQEAYQKLNPSPDDPLFKMFKEAESLHDKIKSDRDVREKSFEALLDVYSKILDVKFGQSTTVPVVATGDAIEVRFDNCPTADAVKPANAGTCDASTATPILIIPVVGQRSPSFSTGIFFTGLDNPSYFKATDGTVQANAEDRFSPVLGALIHTPLVFFRNSYFSAPLSFGVALKDNNPVYLLGMSFIIGRSQRSVFTVGLSGGQVARLSGAALGQTINADQPPTTKVFRTRPMIGFTYNFGTPQ